MRINLNQCIGFFLLAIFSTQSYLYADTTEDYDPSTSVFRFQKQMAKRGNAESQFKLGLMYETGSGIKRSQVLATSWYNKAAAQKHKPAINRLTYLDIKQSGFYEKHNLWLEALKTDARFHEGEALFLLGQMYAEGTGVEKKPSLALNLLRKASAGNIPGADAEIIRIEDELAEIEKQSIKTPTPIAATTPQKTVAIPVVALTSIKIKPAPKHKKVTKSVNTKKAKPKKKNKQIVKTRKPAPKQKRKAKPKTKSKSKPVKYSTPKPSIIKIAKKTEAPHPMDTICGGSNRFRRGCR